MFWHFRALAEPFGNCWSCICDTSHVSNNPHTSSLSTTTTTPSIAMPPPRLAGTTEICPQPFATTMAGPKTQSTTMFQQHERVPTGCMWRCSMDVLHRPTAMSLRSMWQWEQQMFVVSVIPGKRPHYPFMNSHWNPQCHIVRQWMWLPTHLEDRRLPTSHHPPPRSGDNLTTPRVLQPTTPSKVPCCCMHWPQRTRPQPQRWTWQPNGEWWHLSPFAVVDMEIRWHNKWGGHHLDLSTDEVDYVVYNVVNPHVHPLQVSNPPNPVQTPTPTHKK